MAGIVGDGKRLINLPMECTMSHGQQVRRNFPFAKLCPILKKYGGYSNPDPDSLFAIANYDFFRRDRVGKKGAGRQAGRQAGR
jgi:hypothetical protein